MNKKHIGIECRRNEQRELFYGGTLLGVEAFALSTITFESCIIRETGHGMAVFRFLLNALPFSVFFPTKFELFVPELYI